MLGAGAASPPPAVPLAMSAGLLRLRGAAIAVPLLALLAASAWLSPEPCGMETHRQLHLPACGMLARTGWPCPSCGMTTSMSAMAHGRIALAWKAHPFGVVLFIAAAMLSVFALGELATGRDWIARLRPRLWWVIAAIVGMSAGWIVKLATGMVDGSLPVR